MAASVTFGSATARNLCDGLMGQRGWHVDTLKKNGPPAKLLCKITEF